MEMKLIYWAVLGLGAFVAIWMIFVIPSERRYHERKLENIRKRIEKRQAQADSGNHEAAEEADKNREES